MRKKLLAALLLCAMVLTLLPPAQAKAAGIAILYNKKAPNTVLTDKKNTNLYVGGVRINLDYNIGGRTSGVKGTWKSSNTNAVTVDKYWICKAVGNGSAYITFTYKQNGETKQLRCKMRALTRATAVSLMPAMTGFDGTLKIGESANFTANLTVNPKALAVNSSVKSTYGLYFGLYADADCKIAAPDTIATLETTETGTAKVTAKSEGTVYLKVVGKNSPNALAYNVESVAAKIEIKTPTKVEQIDSNKFRVTANTEIMSVVVRNTKTSIVVSSNMTMEPDNKKSAVVTTSQSPLKGDYTVIVNGVETFNITCEESRLEKIELTSNYAILDKTVISGNTYPKAYIYYKLYDQFGNDVTASPLYPTSKFIGIWANNGVASLPEQGVMMLDFERTRETAPQINTAYSISLIYNGSMNIKNESTVLLGAPAMVSSLEFKGIYTYLNAIEGYRKLADANMNMITTGMTVVPYAGTTMTTGAYYLLVSAKDQYGNLLARKGVDDKTVGIYVGGSTNLELASTESIGSIVIDNQQYLAYALSAGTTGKTATGTTNIILSGGTSTPTNVILKVAETAGIERFWINGTAFIKKTGNSYVGQETYLDYSVINTAGNNITDYATLVALTGAKDVFNGTMNMAYLQDQNYLFSNNGGIFRWEKQPDGSAKLWYQPNISSLISSTGVNMAGVDEVITMKGTAKESRNSIVIRVQE